MFTRVVWSALMAAILAGILVLGAMVSFIQADARTAYLCLAGASVTLAVLSLREDR